jgi:hypothetical protein
MYSIMAQSLILRVLERVQDNDLDELMVASMTNVLNKNRLGIVGSLAFMMRFEDSRDNESIKDWLNGREFVLNPKNYGSVYVLIASLIEAYDKSEPENVLSKLDAVLTRNLNRIHKNVDYDPLRVPIVREVLVFLIPVLDALNVYDRVNAEFEIQNESELK